MGVWGGGQCGVIIIKQWRENGGSKWGSLKDWCGRGVGRSECSDSELSESWIAYPCISTH